MIIGSIKEQDKEETRISLTPNVVQKLITKGHRVLLEKGYGLALGYKEETYTKIGAEFFANPASIYQTSEIITQITPPKITQHDIPQCQLFIADFSNKYLPLFKTKIIHLECIPRISVAQSIDILSSQSIVRGYMAALHALYHSNRLAPQITTAASSIKALQALVIGASITGLQAATILKKVGCQVTLSDISEKAKDLAISVGASFILLPQNISELIANKNIIICSASSTAKIISSKDLFDIKKPMTLVDTTINNIKLIPPIPNFLYFYRNIYFERLAPITASDLWSNNILNLLNLICPTTKALDLSINYLQPMLNGVKICSS